jgi:hypothetical protein
MRIKRQRKILTTVRWMSTISASAEYRDSRLPILLRQAASQLPMGTNPGQEAEVRGFRDYWVCAATEPKGNVSAKYSVTYSKKPESNKVPST